MQNYLMNVSYITDEKEVVEFNQEGDPSPRYDIMNFQMIQDGTYDYVMIGEWINHTLNFFRNIQSPPNGPIKSVCSKPCQSGYYKVNRKLGKIHLAKLLMIYRFSKRLEVRMSNLIAAGCALLVIVTNI